MGSDMMGSGDMETVNRDFLRPKETSDLPTGTAITQFKFKHKHIERVNLADMYEIPNSQITVNVEIFAQYVFSRISRSAIDARKFDVSENHNHNRTNRIHRYMRENITTRICLQGLDVRKFSSAKICTFAVIKTLF